MKILKTFRGEEAWRVFEMEYPSSISNIKKYLDSSIKNHTKVSEEWL